MEWQPTPAFLPAEFCGQRSLRGYNPRGRIELEPVEWLTFSLCKWTKVSLYVTQCRKYINFTKLSIHCLIGEKTLKAGVVKNHELCSFFPKRSSCYYIHRCFITTVSPFCPIKTRTWLFIYFLNITNSDQCHLTSLEGWLICAVWQYRQNTITLEWNVNT